MAQTGIARLPLHSGRVPQWLAARMAALGRLITEAIVLEYGRDEFLRRLAHPQWFQAFGAVMGMDWHSSGVTTAVLGALKHGLRPVQWELGLHVCGGRGNESRKTPSELHALGDRLGLDADDLARTSRLIAKVDGAAIQDGYSLYLHGFVVADDGRWTVVQQGMSAVRREARRYHWLADIVTDFVAAPHSAIDGPARADPIVNLTDRQADAARAAQLALVAEGPDAIAKKIRRHGIFSQQHRARTMDLDLPFHHDVLPRDVIGTRLRASLAAAHERGPRDFADLLLTPGFGARTVFALAMVGEVVHGAPSRFTDPARFSLAHGGKDGHPYPVPRSVLDETIRVLRNAVNKAKLGNGERLAAIHRLDAAARRLERANESADVSAFISAEQARWTARPRVPDHESSLMRHSRVARVTPTANKAADNARDQLTLPLGR